MVAVDSSDIRDVEYDPKSKILTIEFCSGGAYEYYDVPENIHGDLMRAESLGGYLAKNIKYEFRFKRIL